MINLSNIRSTTQLNGMDDNNLILAIENGDKKLLKQLSVNGINQIFFNNLITAYLKATESEEDLEMLQLLLTATSITFMINPEPRLGLLALCERKNQKELKLLSEHFAQGFYVGEKQVFWEMILHSKNWEFFEATLDANTPFYFGSDVNPWNIVFDSGRFDLLKKLNQSRFAPREQLPAFVDQITSSDHSTLQSLIEIGVGLEMIKCNTFYDIYLNSPHLYRLLIKVLGRKVVGIFDSTGETVLNKLLLAKVRSPQINEKEWLLDIKELVRLGISPNEP